MSFRIDYKKQAVEQDLPFLDQTVAARIALAIHEKLALDPLRFGKPLRFHWKGARALRVGDYRIIYTVDVFQKTVTILTVGHWRGIYDH